MLVERDERRGDGGSGGEAWWVISKLVGGRVETMTIFCEGRQALALFVSEEGAGLFLRSLGDRCASEGWRVRESRRGEIASLLCGTAAVAVSLDPPAEASDGTAEPTSVDRKAFLAALLSRDGGPVGRAGRSGPHACPGTGGV